MNNGLHDKCVRPQKRKRTPEEYNNYVDKLKVWFPGITGLKKLNEAMTAEQAMEIFANNYALVVDYDKI